MTYTEEEIRQAWGRAALHWNQGDRAVIEHRLIAELGKKDHRHDLADSDTVTAKEVRNAWDRLDAMQGPGSITSGQLLRDISEHREPDYPAYSVWKDANGKIWQRTSVPRSRYGQWLRMGMDGIHGDGSPERPLQRMDVLP